MANKKNLWTMMALVAGLGIGFGVAVVPTKAEAWPGNPECTRNADCDARCDGPGSGVCSKFKCLCLR